MKTIEFPSDFIWGVATASYQIEGAYDEDGRGESIWDRYCSIPNNILNNDNGNIACDHYHKYKEDVKLMSEMGVKAYRFSISWSRILPKGYGEINEKGLQFYVDLVDELLKYDIVPYVTLYHWDLPQHLQDMGGFSNRNIADYFLNYSKIVIERLKGKVKHFITLNEPYCVAFLGNYDGRHAPGIRDFSTALLVSYNMYLCHGLVVKYFRDEKIDGEIGIALNLMGRLPYSIEDERVSKIADGYLNRWFLDPIIKGAYPKDMIEFYKSKNVVIPEMLDEDLCLMSQKLDFIGLNYYNDFHVKENKNVWPLEFEIKNKNDVQVTDRNWPITENGFKDMLLRMKNEYNIENIVITENGASYNDIVEMDGSVNDYQRVDYYKRHLIKMHEAIEEGVNISAYLLWSFLDNFEWSFGYTSRFGIVYVDFKTQKRIVKKSGKWYSKIIETNKIEF